jgi:hypothetical protein
MDNPLESSILVFYPTETLLLRRPSREDVLTRWTFPSAALPTVREQRHFNDNTTTLTNESVEADYDQILALIDSYTQW